MLDSVTDLIFESVYPGADSHGLPVDAVVITPGLSKRLIQPTLQLLKHKEVERVTINTMVVRHKRHLKVVESWGQSGESGFAMLVQLSVGSTWMRARTDEMGS